MDCLLQNLTEWAWWSRLPVLWEETVLWNLGQQLSSSVPKKFLEILPTKRPALKYKQLFKKIWHFRCIWNAVSELLDWMGLRGKFYSKKIIFVLFIVFSSRQIQIQRKAPFRYGLIPDIKSAMLDLIPHGLVGSYGTTLDAPNISQRNQNSQSINCIGTFHIFTARYVPFNPL